MDHTERPSLEDVLLWKRLETLCGPFHLDGLKRNIMCFSSKEDRRRRHSESSQAGKIVSGLFRQQGLRPVLSLQLCRIRPTLAHIRLRYRVKKKASILTKARLNQLAGYYEVSAVAP